TRPTPDLRGGGSDQRQARIGRDRHSLRRRDVAPRRRAALEAFAFGDVRPRANDDFKAALVVRSDFGLTEHMKGLAMGVMAASAVALGLAAEPDGLKLPPGFHATVVAEALGPVRHLAVRDNADIYISTPKDQRSSGGGIIALHLDAAHKADQLQ